MIRHNNIVIDEAMLSITVHGKTVRFYNKRSQFGTFKVTKHLILAGPIGATREDIYHAVHGDCANGGTEGGPHDVHVWLHQMHPRFTELGLELRRERRGSHGGNRLHYYLRPLDVV